MKGGAHSGTGEGGKNLLKGMVKQGAAHRRRRAGPLNKRQGRPGEKFYRQIQAASQLEDCTNVSQKTTVHSEQKPTGTLYDCTKLIQYH